MDDYGERLDPSTSLKGVELERVQAVQAKPGDLVLAAVRPTEGTSVSAQQVAFMGDMLRKDLPEGVRVRLVLLEDIDVSVDVLPEGRDLSRDEVRAARAALDGDDHLELVAFLVQHAHLLLYLAETVCAD